MKNLLMIVVFFNSFSVMADCLLKEPEKLNLKERIVLSQKFNLTKSDSYDFYFSRDRTVCGSFVVVDYSIFSKKGYSYNTNCKTQMRISSSNEELIAKVSTKRYRREKKSRL